MCPSPSIKWDAKQTQLWTMASTSPLTNLANFEDANKRSLWCEVTQNQECICHGLIASTKDTSNIGPLQNKVGNWKNTSNLLLYKNLQLEALTTKHSAKTTNVKYYENEFQEQCNIDYNFDTLLNIRHQQSQSKRSTQTTSELYTLQHGKWSQVLFPIDPGDFFFYSKLSSFYILRTLPWTFLRCHLQHVWSCQSISKRPSIFLLDTTPCLTHHS